MLEITYDAIQPLIREQAPDGDTLFFEFECPFSQRRVKAQYDFPKDSSTSGAMQKTGLRMVLASVAKSIKTVVRMIFGSSIIGKLAASVAKVGVKQAGKEQTEQRKFSTAEKRLGAIEAFKSIADQWLWNAFVQKWILVEEAPLYMSGFELQVCRAALTNNYDRWVSGRLLVELAEFEDRMSAAEEDVLNSYLRAEDESLSAMQRRPPVTDAEVDEISDGEQRVTLAMLGWLMALSDGFVSIGQRNNLVEMGERLKLTEEQQKNARFWSQGHILEQVMRVLYDEGEYTVPSREQAYNFGSQLGLTPKETMVTEARMLKRLSLLADL
jgi:hypothetical protein